MDYLIFSANAIYFAPVVLVQCCLGILFAHAQVPSNSSSYHIRGKEINYLGSSEYMTVFTSFTRASFLNMRADESSNFVTILPYYSLCKMSKNGSTSPLLKCCFFKNIWIYLRLNFFCNVQIKDSCIVDLENRRFRLAFLTFDLRLRT